MTTNAIHECRVVNKVEAGYYVRSGELFVKNMLIVQHHFAMLDLETID